LRFDGRGFAGSADGRELVKQSVEALVGLIGVGRQHQCGAKDQPREECSHTPC
jgi:hypothetical protein